jgi:hypothetical protein
MPTSGDRPGLPPRAAPVGRCPSGLSMRAVFGRTAHQQAVVLSTAVTSHRAAHGACRTVVAVICV